MSSTIEHEKPLEDRTYEQSSMLDAYLFFHFGDKSKVEYTKSTQQTNNVVDSTYTLAPAGENTTHPIGNNNYGDFGYFNMETNSLEEPYGNQLISNIPNFPQQVARVAINWYKKLHPDSSTDGLRAIDIGASVGRTAFELSEYFPRVTGLDFSRLFVQTAALLSQGMPMSYSIPIEGDLKLSTTYQFKPTPGVEMDFIEGNACSLDKEIKYNRITGANLIDRLPSPMDFFTTLPEIVEIGGIVVLTSPYTWLEQYTPRSEWLPNLVLDKETGRKVENSEDLAPTQKTTFEALVTIMSPHFQLVQQSHVPFFIYETARKAQYSLAHCTVWQRK